jgi:hypothetical protein
VALFPEKREKGVGGQPFSLKELLNEVITHKDLQYDKD